MCAKLKGRKSRHTDTKLPYNQTKETQSILFIIKTILRNKKTSMIYRTSITMKTKSRCSGRLWVSRSTYDTRHNVPYTSKCNPITIG